MKRRTKGLLALAGLAGVGALAARALRDAPHEPDDDLTLPADARHSLLDSHDGGTLHVVETGDPSARPIVLLHGITLGAAIWAYQLRDLSDELRVVALDWRGHGQSVAGREGYGLDRLARDLATVLTSLDLDDAVIVGHSMGGMALMRFCGDHAPLVRERVRGLVFLSTSANAYMPGGLTGLAHRLTGAVLVDGHSRFPVPAAFDGATARVPLRFFARGFGRDPRAAHLAHTRTVMAATPAIAAMSSGFGLVSHDGVAALEATDVPALVIVGSRDLLTPPMAARKIASHLRGARVVEIEGGGHQLMLERRAELDAILREFAASRSAHVLRARS